MIGRLTCEQVRDRELIERYVTGRLDDTAAEALEAHALECAECWASIQQAIELRAALAEPAATSNAPVSPVAAARGSWRYGLAAAAVFLVLAGGAAWFVRRSNGPESTVLRGPTEELQISTNWQPDGTLRVDWTRVQGAVSYRVRISNRLTQPIDRLVNAPTVSVIAPAAHDHTTVDVEAENPAGEVIARANASVPNR